MTRLRADFIHGTTVSPIAMGATSMDETALADLPVVVAPDVAVLVLDPLEVNGAAEIVYVTAHSSGATPATILRAQETASGGGAARLHPAGTTWIHAPTAQDLAAIDTTLSGLGTASTHAHGDYDASGAAATAQAAAIAAAATDATTKANAAQSAATAAAATDATTKANAAQAAAIQRANHTGVEAVVAPTAGDVPITAQAHSGQTANLTEWKTSGGVVQGYVSPNNDMWLKGGLDVGDGDFEVSSNGNVDTLGHGSFGGGVQAGNQKITGVADGTAATDGAAYGQVTAAISTAAADATTKANAAAAASIPLTYLDTNTGLTANSDTKVASQKAVKAYADALITANNAMVYKGAIDASANPNYPAASVGWTYRISVAGKIGGASGPNVEVGDLVLCTTANAGGTHAAVGANFTIGQANADGIVIGPASATDSRFAGFDGTSGKLIKDSGFSSSSFDASGAASTAQAAAVQRTNHTGTQLATTISDLAATVKAYRLDEFAAPNANVAWNAKKITGLANGSAAQDAAAFGQIPVVGTTAGTFTEGNDSRIGKINGTVAISGTPSVNQLPFALTGTTGAWRTATKADIPPRAVALTDAATILVNGDTTDIGTVTLGGNRTLDAPSGTPYQGQVLFIWVKQDATGSRTLAYNAIYRFSTGLPSPTLTTTAAKKDKLAFQYDATDAKWDFMAIVPGF